MLKKITIKDNNHVMITDVNYKVEKKCFAQFISSV